MQLQDAKAMIDLQEEAARRYKQYGIKPTQKDFRIKVDNAVTPNQEITNHEINHFKNLDDYIKWLNTMPLADNGNINETENYNFA